MKYPKFFDEVEPIVVEDALAGFLGASEGGVLEYRYLDMVKLAGHSCPTVAGAWLMTKLGLERLFAGELPQRGEIVVEMRGALDEGVVGVIANCIGLVTGATNEGGFKGIGGKFNRAGKLRFGADISGEVRLSRVDTGASVELSYDPSIIPPNPEQMSMMQKIMQGGATPEEKRRFGELWQSRVEEILLSRALWERMITLKG